MNVFGIFTQEASLYNLCQFIYFYHVPKSKVMGSKLKRQLKWFANIENRVLIERSRY